MKLAELLKNVEAREIHADIDLELSGISYDSRSTQAGDLFCARKGRSRMFPMCLWIIQDWHSLCALRNFSETRQRR